MTKQSTGKWGETIATIYLTLHGYSIVERNFSCQLGEVDIIAKKGNVLSFVEVKTRKNADFAPAYEAVTPKKMNRIIRTAQYYTKITRHDYNMSFDIIEVYGSIIKINKINHIKNAFDLW